MTKKKYNHVFTIAFSVESNNDGESVSKEELMEGLLKRVKEIKDTGEIEEACGVPVDTFEFEQD